MGMTLAILSRKKISLHYLLELEALDTFEILSKKVNKFSNILFYACHKNSWYRKTVKNDQNRQTIALSNNNYVLKTTRYLYPAE